MPDILILQNSQAEGMCELGRMMERDGFTLKTYNARETVPDSLHDALVVLGGPQSANDEKQYLRREEDAILRHADAKKPVLGICLGAQLAAKALGARVSRGCKKEVGFYDDLKAAEPDPLFSNLGNFHAFHWHADTFDLPQNSVRLVKSKQYENQAFRHGTVIGLQFHLEVDVETVKNWLHTCADYAAAPDGPGSDAILGEIGEKICQINSDLGIFYSNFKSEFFPHIAC